MQLRLPDSPRSRIAGVLFVLLLIGVLAGSLTPMQGGGASGVDKVQHFGAYAALTALGFAALERRSWILLAGVLLFGAGVEVLQAVLPTGRSGSWLDAGANTAGAATAWLLWTAATRLRR